MTEVAERAVRSERHEAPPPAETSKDYWDLVFGQLGRRKLFRLALVLLALLYASAIYAPLLANDRPYVLEAVDYRGYAQAQRTLYPVTLSLGRLAREGRAGYEASRPAGSTQSFAEALQAEADAAAQRVETMRSYLGSEESELLGSFLSEVQAAVEAALAGRSEEAQERAQAAKEIAGTVRTELRAADPEDPGAGGLELQPVRSWPLFQSITAAEAFFMVLWASVLAWPLWNRLVNRGLLGGSRERIRRARKTKLGAVLGLSLAAALLWSWTVGGGATFEAAPYKRQISEGSLEPLRAIFPPVPFGFAETSSAEVFRPPTWTDAAEISAEGYYVRGPRAPEPDPITGYLPPPTPVEVRHAEPERNAPLRHPLGTDSVGRDLLARMLWGGRVSLSVGLVSAALLVAIGTAIGALAGFFGGWVDLVLSRLLEVVLCFPAFFLILMVVAFTDPSVVPPILAIVVVIAFVRWTGVARLARGEFLRLREREFVLAARAAGVSAPRIIFRHVLPNAVGPVLVAGAFAVAAGILTESALSFLGFGVSHPVPSWGSLVNESRSAEHWWIQFFPGLLIFVTVVCYNLVGDAVRDAVDPRMQLS